MNAVTIKGLSFSYKETPVLEDINVTIPKGDFLAVIGPNGGGKTTLIRLMMGLLTPQKGNVTLFGKPPKQMRHLVGYVSQTSKSDPLFPVTVYDLILTGACSQAKFFGRYPKKVHERANALLEQLHLEKYKGEAFRALSGGTKQKAFLARALLRDPEILFLDESMAHIDSETRKEILSFLFSLKGKKTVILVTHDLHIAFEQVCRFLCVEKTASLMEPKDVCEHFALGLYHTPLHKHE